MIKDRCITGKVILDKKSARSLANLTFKLHHIKTDIYQCTIDHKHWHVTTADDPRPGVNNRKRQFRHNL